MNWFGGSPIPLVLAWPGVACLELLALVTVLACAGVLVLARSTCARRARGERAAVLASRRRHGVTVGPDWNRSTRSAMEGGALLAWVRAKASLRFESTAGFGRRARFALVRWPARRVTVAK